MGMQIHFQQCDLPEGTSTSISYDRESDTWCAVIKFPSGEEIATFCDNPDTTADEYHWFDCGRADQLQMRKIMLLITNRICFTAS